ncbi:MAG TPA: CDP-alcohol phosphatidyltransferase family protein [Acidobacteriaceae bacterium]|nr:CDP-alcohol phosphatidyltransferase family protein [Acidobacteriaceae bacterium]
MRPRSGGARNGTAIDSMNDLQATPNLLTFLRLCIVPFLVLAVLDGRFEMAFFLFVLAGMTDALDGLLARWLQQRTLLGQYLDPVVDKLLLSTLFLVLHHETLISRRVTVLVFARDLGIMVVAAILYATTSIRNFRPSIFGKANTVAQILALAAVMLAQFYRPPWVLHIRSWSLTATVILTLFSGFHYAWRVVRQIGSPGVAG